MKYKVVGWTDYVYNGFKEMPSFNMHAYMTLVREIREKGYRISGYDHQERGWVPVFNTGEIVRMTQRGWGGLMADALQFEQENGYEYSIYGVGGEVMGFNSDTIYGPEDIELPKIEDICDYYKVMLLKKTYESLKSGNNILRFFVTYELSHTDPHDRILLQYRDQIIETEILESLVVEYGKENETKILNYCKNYKYDENSNEERIISIIDPDHPFDSKAERRGLIVRVVKEYCENV